MKENLWEKVVRKMDVPPDIAAGQTKIEMIGARQFYIQNHRGLLEYGRREILINCGKMAVKLTGDGFVIRAMTAGELRVDGLIFSVEYLF